MFGDTSSDSSKRSDALARSFFGISNKSKRIAKDPLKLKQKANSSSENQDSNLAFQIFDALKSTVESK